MENTNNILTEEQLDQVSGGAGSGSSADAKFNIGDWVCYVHNTQIVALITSRTPEEIGSGWKYGVKVNGEGQELRWVGESLLKKASRPG